ncbi:MAG: hypothetical protein ACXVO1_09100 [Tumebacillaceae bacterium]
MSKRRIGWTITLSVLVLVLSAVALLYWMENREPERSPAGATVTEAQLLHDLQTLGTDEVEVSNTPRIVPISGGVGKRIEMQFAVNFRARAHNKPFEVQSAMRVWEYLQERHLPYQVDELQLECIQNLIFTRPAEITIERAEYEQLSQSLGTQPLSEEARITKLTTLWIAKHHYHSRFVN